MTAGAWIALAAVVVAVAFGSYRALTDGRFRGTHRLRVSPITPVVEVRGASKAADSSVVEVRGAPEAADSSVVEVRGAPATSDPVVEVRGAPATSLETTWSHVTTAIPDATLGEKATLLQFSSAFCAPCRATRRTLTEVAAIVPGVEHLEVDAEHHLELVRALGVMRTPTTIVLDAAGREVTRATGAPRKEQVVAALGQA